MLAKVVEKKRADGGAEIDSEKLQYVVNWRSTNYLWRQKKFEKDACWVHYRSKMIFVVASYDYFA